MPIIPGRKAGGVTMPDQQIAVLIDYENVGPSAIQWVLDQVSDLGRATVKRAYADWVAMRDQANQLVELGIEPVQMFRVTRGGKNSSDMRLVIDAIELLYQSPVDTFVIVSSDSDFVALVRKLRSAGKTVIGAGRKATVPRALVASCDRYFSLDDRAGPEQPKPGRSRRASSVAVAPPPPPREDSLLARAVQATMDEQGRAIGSRVFQAMQRMDPAFDFRALGHSTFSRYLEASPEVRVTRPQGGEGDIQVELADRPGVGAAPAQRNGPSWEATIDAAWSARASKAGSYLTGQAAAAMAARALGAPNLKTTQFKTLERLIGGSRLLESHWAREGNRVVRKQGNG
ncbi:MAG: NYN domain-containing protein [Chloroflexi bacterium]|nr:NYN domain-containing protein [Chloroflexota bacterium]